jgi:hypothetical protein
LEEVKYGDIVDVCLTKCFGNLQPVLEAISAPIEFKYPKAPVLARLAVGKTWNEVTVVIHLIFFIML